MDAVHPSHISPFEALHLQEFDVAGINVFVKRDDLMVPFGGNKGRKLKYHLEALERSEVSRFLTFGGPFSNHIYAAAILCRDFGFEGVGVIRGETTDQRNPVLRFARSCGLRIVGQTRTEYALRASQEYLERLTHQYGPCYIIPEGGSGPEGIRGCSEIVPEVINQLGYRPDRWYVAAGTGGTAVGIAASLEGNEKVTAVSALREKVMFPEFSQALNTLPEPDRSRVELDTSHHFGGMAKWTNELIQFMRAISDSTGLPTDPIYTGKALYALVSEVIAGKFEPGSTVVFVHTGGSPGRLAFNYRFPGILDAAKM